LKAMVRRPYFYVEISKLLILALTYIPYLFYLNLGLKAWIVVIGGVYLSGSLILRNLVLIDRLPVWARTLWVLSDTVGAVAVLRINGWDNTYFPAVLAADAAMVGWQTWRGIPHLFLGSAIIMAGRALDWPGAIHFWIHFGHQILVGAVFVQAFVYMATSAQAERERAEQANAQLREHALQVEDMTVLRERNRIAREVHDTIAHAFTGMIMQLEAVKLLLEIDLVQAATKLERVQDKARDSLDEVRRSVHALRPLQLEERTRDGALGRLVEEFRVTTGVQVEMVVLGTPFDLPYTYELCLYRAIQEGLANALRHGRASRVTVHIAYTTEHVTLAIADDGQGITGESSSGLGLLGIRERAALLGGLMTTDPAMGGGFRLEVLLPRLGVTTTV
jgi:signal transduction histidine kinase